MTSADGVKRFDAEPASDATLLLVHTPEFLEATRRAGDGEDGPWGRFGYGPGDNPIFDRMHEAGAIVVGATLAAAAAVLAGDVAHAFNAAGGLHHAMPSRASGFCVYDDPAVAIAWMLTQGVERVAYVDVDVHHGDGPQAIFYDDPRVLTISIHEFAPELGFFPGTGSPDERGGPDAPGSAINVPLAPGTDDAGWLAAFRDTVPAAVRDFGPDVLVTQLGCDTHRVRPARASRSSPPPPIGAPQRSCTSSHTRRPAVDGWRPAAGATSGRASCPGHGRSRSPRWPRSNSPTPCRPPGWRRRRRCRADRSPRRCPTPQEGSRDRSYQARVHPGSGDQHAGVRARPGGGRHLDLPHQLLPWLARRSRPRGVPGARRRGRG